MGQLDCSRHQGMNLSMDGRVDAELKHRLGEDRRVTGALTNVWKKRMVRKRQKCVL